MRILSSVIGRVRDLILPVALVCFILSTGPVHAATAGYPGACFFGDCGVCDCFITATDLNCLKNSIIGLAADYSGCRPQSPDIQEVDGDGVIQAGDVNILQQWIIGNFSNPTGRGIPFAIVDETPVCDLLLAGDTSRLSVRVHDNPSIIDSTSTARAGWGVVFEISTAGCTYASLYGRDPTPLITDPRENYISDASVFEYTTTMAGNGIAEVVLTNVACGSTILIDTYLPGDVEAIPVGEGDHGRFPNRLDGPTIICNEMVDPLCNSLAIDQVAPNVPEGSTVGFTVTCTYSDLTTDDCTIGGGVAWSISASSCSTPGAIGGSTGNYTSGQEAGGAGCSENVTATVSCITAPVYDTETVTVNNDDSVVSIDVTPDSPAPLEAFQTRLFTCTALWSDSSTSDCSLLAAWTVDQMQSDCIGWMDGGTDPVNQYTADNMIWPDDCYDFICADYGGQSGCEWQMVWGDCDPTCAGLIANVYPDTKVLQFDGFQSGVGVINGHTVEFQVGDTSWPACQGTGTEMECWISVVNMSEDDYMANVRVTYGVTCSNCGGIMVNNADLSYGDTIGVCIGETSGDGGCGPPVPLLGAEWCAVEDGHYAAGNYPYNQYGCKVHATASGGRKPFQVLHPDCGSRGIVWKFDAGGPHSPFDFYPSISAEYYPWNPTGTDQCPWTSPGCIMDGDDVRFNFQDRTTYYMMVTDLDNNPGVGSTPNGQAWLIPGSYLRSNVLSGWNAIGNGKAVLAPGRYFGVSVAVEYADRIESYIMANCTQNQLYEYYSQYSLLFRYNPSVARHVQVSGKTPGGTNIRGGARYQCSANEAFNTPCQPGWQPYSGLGTITYGVNDYENTAQGWIALYIDLESNFTFFYRSSIYYTFYGNNILLLGNYSPTPFPSYLAAPKMNAHYGVANINRTLTVFDMYAPGINTTGIVQQGPDAPPEMPLAMYYFQVRQSAASGAGSEFWVDILAAAASFNISYTKQAMAPYAGTLYPSGTKAGSDDMVSICIPFQAGFEANQGCDISLPQTFYDVFSSVENVNLNIGHSGPSAYGGNASGGAVQQWAAHICVQ